MQQDKTIIGLSQSGAKRLWQHFCAVGQAFSLPIVPLGEGNPAICSNILKMTFLGGGQRPKNQHFTFFSILFGGWLSS